MTITIIPGPCMIDNTNCLTLRLRKNLKVALQAENQAP